MIQPFKLVRGFVAILLSYFGWIGVCILVTPWVVYQYLRREHDASIWSAGFLAFCSIWITGWLMDLLIFGLPH